MSSKTKKKELCFLCGASMMKYKHALNKGLAAALLALYKFGKATNISKIGLTHNQICNFQKLKYWDLVRKVGDKGGNSGCWDITDKGIDFINGQILLQKNVWTFRGDPLEFDGAEISFSSICDLYKKRPDYSREAELFK